MARSPLDEALAQVGGHQSEEFIRTRVRAGHQKLARLHDLITQRLKRPVPLVVETPELMNLSMDDRMALRTISADELRRQGASFRDLALPADELRRLGASHRDLVQLTGRRVMYHPDFDYLPEQVFHASGPLVDEDLVRAHLDQYARLKTEFPETAAKLRRITLVGKGSKNSMSPGYPAAAGHWKVNIPQGSLAAQEAMWRLSMEPWERPHNTGAFQYARPISSVATHEFGHAVDFRRNEWLSNALELDARVANPDLPYWRRNQPLRHSLIEDAAQLHGLLERESGAISGYAARSGVDPTRPASEPFAEAFASAYGENPLPRTDAELERLISQTTGAGEFTPEATERLRKLRLIGRRLRQTIDLNKSHGFRGAANLDTLGEITAVGLPMIAASALPDDSLAGQAALNIAPAAAVGAMVFGLPGALMGTGVGIGKTVLDRVF